MDPQIAVRVEADEVEQNGGIQTENFMAYLAESFSEEAYFQTIFWQKFSRGLCETHCGSEGRREKSNRSATISEMTIAARHKKNVRPPCLRAGALHSGLADEALDDGFMKKAILNFLEKPVNKFSNKTREGKHGSQCPWKRCTVDIRLLDLTIANSIQTTFLSL